MPHSRKQRSGNIPISSRKKPAEPAQSTQPLRSPRATHTFMPKESIQPPARRSRHYCRIECIGCRLGRQSRRCWAPKRLLQKGRRRRGGSDAAELELELGRKRTKTAACERRQAQEAVPEAKKEARPTQGTKAPGHQTVQQAVLDSLHHRQARGHAKTDFLAGRLDFFRLCHCPAKQRTQRT